MLDLDATDDPLYGNQEGRFFHGHYDCYRYMPLYILCGEHLLCARLRPSNQDGGAGSLEELERTLDQELFTADGIADRASELQDLIRPFVEAEEAPYTQLQNIQAFEQAIDGPTGLFDHVTSRRQAVEEVVARR